MFIISIFFIVLLVIIGLFLIFCGLYEITDAYFPPEHAFGTIFMGSFSIAFGIFIAIVLTIPLAQDNSIKNLVEPYIIMQDNSNEDDVAITNINQYLSDMKFQNKIRDYEIKDYSIKVDLKIEPDFIYKLGYGEVKD